MQLNDIVDVTFNRLFGRLLRRALGAALLVAFAVVALYYASGAGTLALTQSYLKLFERRGGQFLTGDAASFRPASAGYGVETARGPVLALALLIAK